MSSVTSANSIDLSVIKAHHSGQSAAAKRYQENLDFAAMVRSNTNRGVEDNESRVNSLVKPDAGYFAEITGVDEGTAMELIHGVVGSNKDTRNWQAIMTSDDPLSAVRAETAKMYNSGADYASAHNNNKLSPSSTLAKEGNFALEQVKLRDGTVGHQGLKLIDSQGMILRDAGKSAEQIQRNSWLFGFDTAQLSALVAPAQQLSSGLSNAIARVSHAGAEGALTVPFPVPGQATPATPANAGVSPATPATPASPPVATESNPVSNDSSSAASVASQASPTTPESAVTALQEQINQLTSGISTGTNTPMSSFMNSYNQLQALMAKMTDLQKTLAAA